MHMKHDARILANEKLHASVREIRGGILNSVAVIDANISKILSGYFCTIQDKRDLLMSEVFTCQSYGLRTKILLLKKILKKELASYLEENDWLFSDLEKLKNLRNKLAHATIDTSERAHIKAGTEVGFISYENGKTKTKVVTFEKADELRVKANMISGCLNDISRLLGIKL